MKAYLFPIETAVYTFLALSVTAMTPYIIYQYFKHGSVSILRSLILFSFSYYLLTAYYLIILPLPDPASLKPYESIFQFTNLYPLKFVFDFVTKTSFRINDVGTYLKALGEGVFIQPFFNLVLTIPFGIYLGYYFKQSLKKTVIITFALSLFFEITQLSGLYGFYSSPYRLFDVDDLLLNTLGGVIGFFIYSRYLHFLLSREQIDEKNRLKSEKVGYLRRYVAFRIDYWFITIIFSLSMFLLNQKTTITSIVVHNIVLLLYFIVAHKLFNRTLGKATVHIALITTKEDIGYMAAIVKRYLLLYVPLIPLSILDHLLNSTEDNGVYGLLYVAIELALLIIIAPAVIRKQELLHDKLAHTKNINVLKQ